MQLLLRHLDKVGHGDIPLLDRGYPSRYLFSILASLLDSAKYKLEELGELYQLRWGIEEGYKMYKARVQVETFSGKTATAVKQDIYAKIMMMSLCASLAFPINRTCAYWATKTMLIGMFIKKKS